MRSCCRCNDADHVTVAGRVQSELGTGTLAASVQEEAIAMGLDADAQTPTVKQVDVFGPSATLPSSALQFGMH